MFSVRSQIYLDLMDLSECKPVNDDHFLPQPFHGLNELYFIIG